MADHGPSRTGRRGHITDARGRKVTQLDPVALHLLHRHEAIPAEDLRAIAAAIDPLEVRRRPRAALWTPIWIVLWYAAFFGYFHIFNRWRGWDPVLMMFAAFYFLFPLAWLYFGFRRARRARWERIRRINGRLLALAPDQPDAAERQLVEVERRLRANAILRSREYPFCLYPPDDLAAFYREAVRPRREEPRAEP